MALLALIAGTVSYLHMHLLVELHGQPGWVAALTPLSVDGMLVAASTTSLADSRAGQHGGKLPWALLVAGSAASLAANVAVAQPTVAGRVIAAWPSFALIGAYALAHRAGDGPLPSGSEIGRQCGRHEGWGRLVNAQALSANSMTAASPPNRVCAWSRHNLHRAQANDRQHPHRVSLPPEWQLAEQPADYEGSEFLRSCGFAAGRTSRYAKHWRLQENCSVACAVVPWVLGGLSGVRPVHDVVWPARILGGVLESRQRCLTKSDPARLAPRSVTTESETEPFVGQTRSRGGPMSDSVAATA